MSKERLETRRRILSMLGLGAVAVYATPVLTNLSQARASHSWTSDPSDGQGSGGASDQTLPTNPSGGDPPDQTLPTTPSEPEPGPSDPSAPSAPSAPSEPEPEPEPGPEPGPRQPNKARVRRESDPKECARWTPTLVCQDKR